MTCHANHTIRATAASTALPDDLLQAYLHTSYRVHPSSVADAFTLHVGVTCNPLKALMSRFKRPSAAFITAYNPLGQALTDEENQARHLALQQELVHRSLPHWPGIGEGDDNTWPGEESFLVLGLDLAAAQRLGQAYEQNALVWAGADAVPKLVLLQ